MPANIYDLVPVLMCDIYIWHGLCICALLSVQIAGIIWTDSRPWKNCMSWPAIFSAPYGYWANNPWRWNSLWKGENTINALYIYISPFVNIVRRDWKSVITLTNSFLWYLYWCVYNLILKEHNIYTGERSLLGCENSVLFSVSVFHLLIRKFPNYSWVWLGPENVTKRRGHHKGIIITHCV